MEGRRVWLDRIPAADVASSQYRQPTNEKVIMLEWRFVTISGHYLPTEHLCWVTQLMSATEERSRPSL